MRLKLIIVFCLTFLTVSAQEFVQKSASADFKIKNMGFNVVGTFNDVNIVTNFDKNNLSESFVMALISINSIDTKNRKRDKHLINADYFESATYGYMKLKSVKISKVKKQNYSLTAKLTIKKTTKQIVIPIEIMESNGLITLKSKFSINRLDYGVGESSWVMSDTVNIEVNFTGEK